MENIEFDYGCVYFFRHIGLSPVKIGYSTNESPLGRFEQFKTYAPYGAEIVGFIQTTEAKELEHKLHLKYQSKRLGGEWFELTDEEIEQEINFHTNSSQAMEKNMFQQAWAKHLADVKKTIEFEKNKTLLEKIDYLYKINPDFNRKKVAQELNVSRRTVIRHANKIKELRHTVTNVTAMSQRCHTITD